MTTLLGLPVPRPPHALLRKHHRSAGIDVGLGAQITVNSKPSGLDPFYGSGTPVSFEIFFRIRPSHMDHPHEHMPGQMPAAEHAH